MDSCYPHLSLEERRKTANWRYAKIPVSEIAEQLGRDPSTIHREIKRNFWADDAFPKKYGGYFGHSAQLQTTNAGRC